MAFILHVFLPIQHQAQKRTQQSFDMISRCRIRHASLDILWTKVRCRSGKHIVETRAEHHDELDDCDKLANSSKNAGGRDNEAPTSFPKLEFTENLLRYPDYRPEHIRAVVKAPVSAAEIRFPS